VQGDGEFSPCSRARPGDGLGTNEQAVRLEGIGEGWDEVRLFHRFKGILEPDAGDPQGA
jgi:hypothetical protein